MINYAMMDLNILVIITCVCLASFLSLIFINKIFRRKTFEEIIAEKKALSANLYAHNKSAAAKKPKKKELKREKKQRQKEQKDAILNENEQQQQQQQQHQDDSDAQSEQASVEDDSQPGLSKLHVEFEPEPEIVTYPNAPEDKRRASNSEKDNNNKQHQPQTKTKKDKKNASKATAGILINKHEHVAVKHVNADDAQQPQQTLNNFEAKPPKDVLELKKSEKEKEKDKERKDDANNKQQKHQSNATANDVVFPAVAVASAVTNKKEKNAKKEKITSVEKLVPAPPPHVAAAVEQPVEVPHVAKELFNKQQQHEEKSIRHGSPKTQQNSGSHKAKQQNKKQQQHQQASGNKELLQFFDKLSENETIGVSLLMNIFRRAELNRSEIQILIDYLLNKQQDMPTSHSEWSDDLCQKLKRQLQEKEKALAEEQEASIGIQAKIRDLRAEVNTERAQMNATLKAYTEKVQGKDQEINVLNQEIQALNEKFAKLVREKQARDQDLLGQLQLMQNELAHKDKCIAELTTFMNAKNDSIIQNQVQQIRALEQQHGELEQLQTQVQQIRALEQQRDELEQLANSRLFEREKLQILETENAEIKVEMRNLQNALESAKLDALQKNQDIEALNNELTVVRDNELREKQNKIANELTAICNTVAAQTKEQTQMQATIDALQDQLAQKEQHLHEINCLNEKLRQQFDSVTEQSKNQELEWQSQLNAKAQQLAEFEQLLEKRNNDEKELLQQLQEQREKNNDLRMKNWKLIEAMQNAEAKQKQNENLKQKQKDSENEMLTNANTTKLVSQQQMLANALKAAETAASTATANSNGNDYIAKHEQQQQQNLRQLLQRLCPDAVKAAANTELTLSFDQYIEHILAAHIAQLTASITAAATAAAAANSSVNSKTSSSNKSTQSNESCNNSSSNSNNVNSCKNHLTNNTNNNNDNINSSNNNNNNNSNSTHSNSATYEDSSGISSSSSSSNKSNKFKTNPDELFTQNLKLQRHIEELTELATITSNTLADLEERARQQDEHWRSVVQQKDEIINTLQHANGEQQRI